MPNDRILSGLSLAQKAGQVASGEFSAEKAVKEGRAFLVLVAGDASANTKKKMKNMAEFYEVPIYFYSEKENLGRCIGKEYRAVAAVTHPGFADSIEKQLKLHSQLNREEQAWQK
ncbi:MAG: ribosomal L7Ae/L30e/S12e/Gadd45 family protein [Lachnospiraceae bacterium]|nr:ribosomal L7Ae/L30e/S12e/Gadd45 family protein [Lachnospiraceae bacterium]